MSDLCSVEIERAANVVIARIVGEVDLSNQAEVVQQLEAMFTGNAQRHIVDLSETTYLDSVGIHMLIALSERLRTRRHELHLIVPVGSLIGRVLEIVDMQRVVPIHRERSDALA